MPQTSTNIHVNHSIRRLPAMLPIRPRLETVPFDKNGWAEHGDATPSPSNPPPTASPVDDDKDRYVRTWEEHVPHTGRHPPQKGVANFRGSTTDAERREIVHESTMERAASTIVLADGRKRLSSGIDDTIAMVRKERPDFCDEVQVWTEEQLPRCAEHNAGLILRSRKLRNDDDIAELRRFVDRIVGVVHVGHLIRHAQYGRARAFTAIVNLIDDGILVAIDRERIRPELRVCPGERRS